MESPPTNAHEFTVTELAGAVRRTVEEEFQYVRVRGEISGFRGQHSSGHAYFSLKDDGAVIDSVVWKGTWGKLRFKPEEGMEVIATGRLTTYPRSSKYQIVIEQIEPAGAGALMALLEERRRKLAAEGLFAPERKAKLPYLPRVIGVVTSPTGAVIRDILHRLDDRFPSHVIVWPVRVQGETAAAEIAAAVDGFNALPPDGPIARPDLLIVARGGGSIEDLWCFNEEIVVRAVASSRIPVISGVGHETDTTLVDFAADQRAPTPTAAAEMAVPVRADLLAYVDEQGTRSRQALRSRLSHDRDRLRAAAGHLPRPADLLNIARQRLDLAASELSGALRHLGQTKRLAFERTGAPLRTTVLTQRLDQAARRLDDVSRRARLAVLHGLDLRRGQFDHNAARLSPVALVRDVQQARKGFQPVAAALLPALSRSLLQRNERLAGLGKLLVSFSHKGVLARGYALVTDSSGGLVRSSSAVQPGQPLTVEVADGAFGVTVAGAPSSAAAPAKKQRPPLKGGGQESLF